MMHELVGVVSIPPNACLVRGPDVDAIGQQAARPLVSQVVSAQVDAKLIWVPCRTFLSGLRFDAVGQQPERVSRGLDVRLRRAVRAAEHVGFGTKPDRRFGWAASRPFGLNGIRRFSLSFAV